MIGKLFSTANGRPNCMGLCSNTLIINPPCIILFFWIHWFYVQVMQVKLCGERPGLRGLGLYYSGWLLILTLSLSASGMGLVCSFVFNTEYIHTYIHPTLHQALSYYRLIYYVTFDLFIFSLNYFKVCVFSLFVQFTEPWLWQYFFIRV